MCYKLSGLKIRCISDDNVQYYYTVQGNKFVPKPKRPPKQIKLLWRWRCWSQWPRGLRRGSAAARLLGLWVRIPPEGWMSQVNVVCFLVQVSVSVLSITQKNPTEYSLSECDREPSISRRSWAWTTRGCCGMEKNENGGSTCVRNVVTNLLSYTLQ
jgi:hypothetical protein